MSDIIYYILSRLWHAKKQTQGIRYIYDVELIP